MKTKVAIVKGNTKPSEKEIDALVRKAIECAGGLTGVVKQGDVVLIKPNIVSPAHPDTGITTDPRICQTIANMVREIGAKPVIGEASLVSMDTEECFQAAGYGNLREKGYEVVNLKEEGIEMVKVPIPKGKMLKEVSLPKIVAEADVIISVPKMKTHDTTGVTLSLKNMKGVLPDKFKKKFHTTFGVLPAVVDLCTVVKPALAVVDGIIAMEGLGPMDGEPVEMGLIIAGKDPVATDAVTRLIMGFEPVDNSIVHMAALAGIGVDDLKKIEVVGEPIDKIKRRFVTCLEALQEMIPLQEGFRFIGETACSGCKALAFFALKQLEELNKLDRVAGWTMVVGKIDKLPDDIDREKLLLVGVCTARFKNEGIYIKGCPPLESEISAPIAGEEIAPWWD